MNDNDKEVGKSMAKWAALGAVVARTGPLVGPIIGAAGAAGYGYFKAKKKA